MFLYFREMELSGANIKFFFYISGNENPKKISDSFSRQI